MYHWWVSPLWYGFGNGSLNGEGGAEVKVTVKTKKEGENYHDHHAVLYLGFTLTVLG